jgi:hypothetical protein
MGMHTSRYVNKVYASLYRSCVIECLKVSCTVFSIFSMNYECICMYICAEVSRYFRVFHSSLVYSLQVHFEVMFVVEEAAAGRAGVCRGLPAFYCQVSPQSFLQLKGSGTGQTSKPF